MKPEKEVRNMFYYRNLVPTIHEKKEKSWIKTINANCKSHHGMENLNCCLGPFLLQIFKIIWNISSTIMKHLQIIGQSKYILRN